MANEKVSQMTSLTAAEIAGEDLFLITDMSARESKKLAASDMLWYIQTTGSFNAATAVNADTASHLLPIGRNITVTSASYSTTSSYSHFAERVTHSDTSSLAETASYVDLSGMGISEVDTASFLKHTTGINNGTSSYSLTSSFVNASKTSSFLLYTPGVNNGTSSYSITSSHAITASHATSARSSSYSISSSNSLTSSFTFTSMTSSYSLTGIVGCSSAIAHVRQVGPAGGTTEAAPADVTGLEANMSVHSINSYFLINISVVCGNGNTGDTMAGLWYVNPSSVASPLISCIAASNTDDQECITLSATYIHRPSVSVGSSIKYKGVIFNPDDRYYANRSENNLVSGTSSISVLEFVL